MSDDNGRIGGAFLPGNPFPNAHAELYRLLRHYQALGDKTGHPFDFFGWMLEDNAGLDGMSPFVFTERYCELSGADALPERVRGVLRRDLMRLT